MIISLNNLLLISQVYFSLKLTHFEKFDDTTEALAAATATVEGKISKPLKKLLKHLVNSDIQEQLLVADSTLGKAIKVCLFVMNSI
jgi:nucleolar protein 58